MTGQIPARGEMQAKLEGLGFGMQLGARSDGKRQAITNSSQGADVQGVSITLRQH